MHVSPVNYLAVLVSGIVIFLIGGAWYSPALFAHQWVALQGRTEEELKATSSATPGKFIAVFICAVVSAWVLGVLLNHFVHPTLLRGAEVGLLCWIGFTGATSFGSYMFSGRPRALWAIDSGYYLVSFVVAGIILAVWR